ASALIGSEPQLLDLGGVFSSQREEMARLERILAALEADTGYKLRVLTLSPQLRGDAAVLSQARQTLRIQMVKGRIEPNAALILADRGIPGSLEAGSPYLRYDVGDNVRLVLPDIFWGRLQREYGKRAFVEARGDAASIIVTCELVLTFVSSHLRQARLSLTLGEF
ncbi:MAG: hypothetical protein SGPRY_012843, partial [Prymnesium sp.]